MDSFNFRYLLPKLRPTPLPDIDVEMGDPSQATTQSVPGAFAPDTSQDTSLQPVSAAGLPTAPTPTPAPAAEPLPPLPAATPTDQYTLSQAPQLNHLLGHAATVTPSPMEKPPTIQTAGGAQSSARRRPPPPPSRGQPHTLQPLSPTCSPMALALVPISQNVLKKGCPMDEEPERFQQTEMRSEPGSKVRITQCSNDPTTDEIIARQNEELRLMREEVHREIRDGHWT